MAGGVNDLASLQGRVTATGALAVTIAASTGAAPGVVGGGINPLFTCQGRVTAANELVIRTV